MGSHFCFLLGGAAAEDQFGGDLRAGAERADADIAAREFLRHHAHGFLAEPHAAEIFRNGQPEHAELRHLPDDFHRDVAVGAVPGLRVADHLAVGEFAHFLADRFQRLVEAAGADRGVVARAHQFDQPGAPLRGIAGGDQTLDVRIEAGRNLRRGKPEIARPHHFALAHRNAADDLGEIFAERDAHQMFFDLAERAGGRPCARHRRRAGARPPHRWRARRAHAWRAARGRTGGATGWPSTTTLSRTLATASASKASRAAVASRLRSTSSCVGGRAGGGDRHGLLEGGDINVPAVARHYACSAQKQSGHGIGRFPAALQRHSFTKLLQN